MHLLLIVRSDALTTQHLGYDSGKLDSCSRLLRHVQAGLSCCSKIAEAEAVVSVNEKKCLVMHMHVWMRLDELRGPPNPWLTVT
jgi:hypothetical protein